MKQWRILAVAIGAATVASVMASDDGDARIKQLILHSQRLGAHGLGYNADSMQELSKKLGANDIPSLIRLLKDEDVDIAAGAKFGLASQCGAAIEPVQRAAEKPYDMLLAEVANKPSTRSNRTCSKRPMRSWTRSTRAIGTAWPMSS